MLRSQKAALRTALFLASAFMLAACGDNAPPEAAAPPAPAGPPSIPSLWGVNLLDAEGRRMGEARVCDDGSLRAAFARALPAPEGQPCMLEGEPAIGADAFAANCRAGETTWIAETDPQGDLGRVFTMEVSLKPDAGAEAAYEQTAMFRRVGDCPADWAHGDAAAPNSAELVNVLTGETKTGAPQR